MLEVLRYKQIHLLVLIGAVVFFAFGIYLFADNETQAEEISTERKEDQYIPESVSTFEFPVAGIIEASDSITVRAQTGGIVQKLFAEEGDTVERGSTLLAQEVPLVKSRISLLSAQNGYNELSNEASSIAQTGSERVAGLQSEGASSTAFLTRESERTALENQTALLVASLHGSVIGLVTVLDFIDENQQFFNAKSLSEFRNTVGTLYGNSKPYLTGSVQYRLESRDDVLALLENTTNGETSLDPHTLLELADLIDEELTAVRNILTEGESEFLDARVISTDDPLYSAYLEKRNSIVATETNLRTVAGTLQNMDLSGGLNTLSAVTQNEVMNAQALTATLLAGNAERMVTQAEAVSDASLGVLYSEEVLGRPVAPFTGTVGDVFVHEGEFVMSGTSLMTFIGTGAREVKVTVPPSMLQYVNIGAPFIVDSVTTGHVERLTRTLSNGSATIVIGLESGEYTVGEVLRGNIQGDLSQSEGVAIVRSYVHFDNKGAYVRTESGRDIRAKIFYDTGELYVVKLEDTLTEGILKARGIEL